MTTTPEPRHFTSHGLACAIIKGPLGAWCGYVSVPEGHPLHGKSHRDRIPTPKAFLEQELDLTKRDMIGLFLESFEEDRNTMPLSLLFEVHGGITWTGKGLPWDDGGAGWGFGFDCAHYGDWIPSPEMASVRRELGHPIKNEHETYRNAQYVEAECRNLAEQVAAYAPAVKEDPTV